MEERPSTPCPLFRTKPTGAMPAGEGRQARAAVESFWSGETVLGTDSWSTEGSVVEEEDRDTAVGTPDSGEEMEIVDEGYFSDVKGEEE